MWNEDWLERTALGASFLCLVHCLALPLLIALIPALDAMLHVPESFHMWLLALAAPVSGLTLWSGRMRHGATWPLLLGTAGLALLALGASTSDETPATVLGSLALVGAHLANWRLRHAGHVHA